MSYSYVGVEARRRAVPTRGAPAWSPQPVSPAANASTESGVRAVSAALYAATWSRDRCPFPTATPAEDAGAVRNEKMLAPTVGQADALIDTATGWPAGTPVNRALTLPRPSLRIRVVAPPRSRSPRIVARQLVA